MLRSPGKDGEGIQVGAQVLVALLNAREALDGTAVDHHLSVHGLLDLADGDRHVFELAEDVGKLHADELHVALARHADDVFLAVLAHGCDLPEKMKRAKVFLRITPLLCTLIIARLLPAVNRL